MFSSNSTMEHGVSTLIVPNHVYPAIFFNDHLKGEEGTLPAVEHCHVQWCLTHLVAAAHHLLGAVVPGNEQAHLIHPLECS